MNVKDYSNVVFI